MSNSLVVRYRTFKDDDAPDDEPRGIPAPGDEWTAEVESLYGNRGTYVSGHGLTKGDAVRELIGACLEFIGEDTHEGKELYTSVTFEEQV